jgi:hypothetical protein
MKFYPPGFIGLAAAALLVATASPHPASAQVPFYGGSVAAVSSGYPYLSGPYTYGLSYSFPLSYVAGIPEIGTPYLSGIAPFGSVGEGVNSLIAGDDTPPDSCTLYDSQCTYCTDTPAGWCALYPNETLTGSPPSPRH